jgi:NitT/TauT family transport system ATP-binding protein
LTLEIDPLSQAVRTEVRQLATEVGLSTDELALQTAALSPSAQLRLRVGRALALHPRVLLAEHPNALLPREESSRFASDLARIMEQRGIAALVMTADPTFARAVAARVLEVQPATGALLEKRFGLGRWFS